MSPPIQSVARRAGMLVAILACSAAISPLSGTAHAQSMDYGALQELFGESVTTSATGSPQRVTEVPADMIIVTADDIRRSGAHDIPGVLRHVAGIDVLQWANDNADVSVRGYDQAFSSRLLVLIDGRQVYADYYGFTAWSTLPIELSAIRQIEIVKGPNSALFGFNAVGGVINIITYNPRYDDVNTASVTGGTQDRKEGSAVTTFRLGDDAAFRLSAGARQDDDFSTPIPAQVGGVPRERDDRVAVDIDGTIRLADKVELGLEASHSDVQENEMDLGYSLVQARYITDSLKAQLLADSGVGLLKLTAYANWTGQNSLIPIPLGAVDLQSGVYVVQGEDVIALDNDNTARLALEYRHDFLTTAPVVGATISYDVLSASGMWSWKMAPDLTMTNAVRVDRLSLGRSGFIPTGYPFTNADWTVSHIEVSFNSGLVWKADADDTIRILASRGIQAPSLESSGGLLIVSPYLNITGIPTLPTTAVMNYEARWDRALASLDTSIGAAVFHQESVDLTSELGGVLVTQTSFYVTPAKAGSSHADGVELTAKGAFLDNWRWGAGYRLELIGDSFTAAEQSAEDYLEFEKTTPQQLVNANLGWSDEKWETDAYVRYQSGMTGLRTGSFGIATVPVSPYVSVDGRVAYRLLDWATLALSGQNLLTARQQQTTGPDVERRVLAILSVTF